LLQVFIQFGCSFIVEKRSTLLLKRLHARKTVLKHLRTTLAAVRVCNYLLVHRIIMSARMRIISLW